MSPIFKKLNLTTQGAIVVLNAPPSFESEIASLVGVSVGRTLAGPGVPAEPGHGVSFALPSSVAGPSSMRCPRP